jgi:tetratricopeptide (TPR) repeat protein
MSEFGLQVVPRSAADRARLAAAVQNKITREEIVGHEKMIEADPTSVALHDYVALLYVQAGVLNRAAEHFAESLRLKPEVAATHYNLGMALMFQGRREAARNRLRDAIRLNPDYPMALTRLAWLLATSADARLREPDEALRLAERAAALTRPPTPLSLDVLAAALAASGQFDRAVDAMESAVRLVPAESRDAAALRQRLQMYMNRQPYVE